MGRSSSRRGIVFALALDRWALSGIALGIALYVMPLWREGRLRAALWITLLSTLLHAFTSRERAEDQAEDRAEDPQDREQDP